MESFKELCPLSTPSLNGSRRLHRLSDMEEMLTSTYEYYFRQVIYPYSREDEEVIVRIAEMFSSKLHEASSEVACTACQFAKDDLAFWGKKEFFRMDLPSVDPFSASSRSHCLRVLEKKLNCFFVNESRSVPYSWVEKQKLRRMKKMFVHELRNTDKYALFKGTRVRRVSEEEKLELKRQKTDEIRLKVISLCRYNPQSQKYKKKKEEFLRALEEKFGKL